MEVFMENSGLRHIGEKILRTVDFRTQLSCRLVNKSWNQILENYAEKSKIGLKDLIQPIIKSMVASQKGANNPKEESARSSRVINWCYFAQKLFAEVHNPWINIYFQKHVKFQAANGFSSFTLEYFVLKRNVKLVDFICKENLHQTFKDSTLMPTFSLADFCKALKLANESQDAEIVEYLKNLTIANY